MDKKILFLLGIIFSSCLISALQFSLEPTITKLQTQPETLVCTNISLTSDQATIVTISNKWGRSSSDNINNYGMDPEAVAIKTSMPKQTVIGAKETTSVEVCFNPGGEGRFYGVIIFESFNHIAKAGGFVELDASYQATLTKKTLPGMEHREIGEVSTEQTIIAFSILNTLFLICVLVYLLKTFSKKKVKK